MLPTTHGSLIFYPGWAIALDLFPSALPPKPCVSLRAALAPTTPPRRRLAFRAPVFRAGPTEKPLHFQSFPSLTWVAPKTQIPFGETSPVLGSAFLVAGNAQTGVNATTPLEGEWVSASLSSLATQKANGNVTPRLYDLISDRLTPFFRDLKRPFSRKGWQSSKAWLAFGERAQGRERKRLQPVLFPPLSGGIELLRSVYL